MTISVKHTRTFKFLIHFIFHCNISTMCIQARRQFNRKEEEEEMNVRPAKAYCRFCSNNNKNSGVRIKFLNVTAINKH